MFDFFQSNKPLLEKKRRARINKSLDQLKGLVLDALKKDVSILLTYKSTSFNYKVDLNSEILDVEACVVNSVGILCVKLETNMIKITSIHIQMRYSFHILSQMCQRGIPNCEKPLIQTIKFNTWNKFGTI